MRDASGTGLFPTKRRQRRPGGSHGRAPGLFSGVASGCAALSCPFVPSFDLWHRVGRTRNEADTSNLPPRARHLWSFEQNHTRRRLPGATTMHGETQMTGTGTLLRATVAALAIAAGTTAFADEAAHGVSDTEILVGTVTDLSGVTAIQGVNNANAIRLLFDEVNAAGGINGRKIRYIVEDSQYQVPRAVQAMNKLLNSDKVFMTLQ